MEIDILTDEQYNTLSKRLVNAIERHYKIIALNTLQSPGYILRKPIYITIEIEVDKVIASLDDIEAFAYADTEYEEISHLCKEIVSVYEDLKEDKDNLGKLPGKWLAFLDEVIDGR
jgi:hypothetical protein